MKDSWRDTLVMLWGTVGAILGGGGTLLFLLYGFKLWRYLAVGVLFGLSFIASAFRLREESVVGQGAALVALGLFVLMTVLGYVAGARLAERRIPKSFNKTAQSR